MLRVLLRLGLDSVEDEYWARVGEERLATWDGSKALTHEQVWGQAAGSGRSELPPNG
jgi:hypothetical protein